MGATSIPYATKSWNPVHGCTPIGQGCLHCWARRVAETRLRGRAGYPEDEPFRVVLDVDRINEPLHWRKPQRVMTCSMGDLFHDEVGTMYLEAVFATMRACDRHTFMVFTKRVDRMLQFFRYEGWEALPNVWIIASASTQAEVDRIAPVLLQIPAAKRGLSLEPLVEGVDVRPYLPHKFNREPHEDYHGPFLDWLIVGCESGKDRRGMLESWTRSLRDQCRAANVPFYLKQAVDITTGTQRVIVHPYLDGRQHMEIPA